MITVVRRIGSSYNPDPTLNNNEWETIALAYEKGDAQELWPVGATKNIVINGLVGTQQFNNFSLDVFIIGYDHNAEREGLGITFELGKVGGKDICLVDSHYNDYSDGAQKWFNMSHSKNTNYDGWKGCDLRYDLLGSTNVNNGDATSTCATSPVANTLMAALPADLRAVMKPMTIYTDNAGGLSNPASNVTASVDYLPLLAEFEIFGTRRYANSAEQNYQQQYQYYKSGNSKVKYRHSSTSSTARWWGRSPYADHSNLFCGVSTYGYANSVDAYYSYGVTPIFRIS